MSLFLHSGFHESWETNGNRTMSTEDPCQMQHLPGFRFAVHDCPNMKEKKGDLSMEYEHYECKVCGKYDKLDYEEMR